MTGSELFALAGKKNVNLSWTGFDLLVDFYKLYFGFDLALRDIPASRLMQYQELMQLATTQLPKDDLQRFLYGLCEVMGAKMKAIKNTPG
jgi:hypothetical protein